jgi:polyketide synthase PksM
VTSAAQPSYRHGGVYVVIGGAGGIGEVLSEHLIRHYNARVIWIGRRKLNAEIVARQARMSEFGQPPQYIRADATSYEELLRAYHQIKENHPRIHGVIHSAIVLCDQSLVNMDEAVFEAGLAAKVDVSVRLAQVFGGESLDFALFFSSMQSFTKAAGQSNYAAGCTFKDAFAKSLSARWHCPVKVMNWGYWGSIGIVASATQLKRMEQAGIGSIEPGQAMSALEHLLASPYPQLALIQLARPRATSDLGDDESVMALSDDVPSVLHEIQAEIAGTMSGH